MLQNAPQMRLPKCTIYLSQEVHGLGPVVKDVYLMSIDTTSIVFNSQRDGQGVPQGVNLKYFDRVELEKPPQIAMPNKGIVLPMKGAL